MEADEVKATVKDSNESLTTTQSYGLCNDKRVAKKQASKKKASERIGNRNKRDSQREQ